MSLELSNNSAKFQHDLLLTQTVNFHRCNKNLLKKCHSETNIQFKERDKILMILCYVYNCVRKQNACLHSYFVYLLVNEESVEEDVNLALSAFILAVSLFLVSEN